MIVFRRRGWQTYQFLDPLEDLQLERGVIGGRDELNSDKFVKNKGNYCD